MKRSQIIKQPSQQQIQTIVQALNSGDAKRAAALAKKQLKQFPHAFVLHHLSGNALAAQQKTKEAISAFRKALTIDPTVAELHMNVAILLGQLNRTEEAIPAYKQAIKYNDSLTDAHYNLGTALQKQGQWAQAAECYRKALSLEPGFHEAMVNLGVVLQQQDQLAEAIAVYQQALTIAQDAKIYFNLGTALKNTGKLDEAIASYQQALTLAPNYAEVHSNLGEVLRDQGHYQQAVSCYQQALALDPELPAANYSLAVFLYDSGDLAAAADYFQRSRMADWEERSLYCLYKAERFSEFKQGLDALTVSKHNSPFLATLAEHYAQNFSVANHYDFCPEPMTFVFHTAISELQGEPSELREAVLQAIELAEVSEKKQGRLINGVQSAGNLLKRPEPAFTTLAGLVMAAIKHYQDHFSGKSCEFIRSFPRKIEIASSWYVKMQQGGHLTSHIHEEGWISGALYLALPTDKQHPDEGSIELSTDGDNYPKQHNDFPRQVIAPEVGDIIMFPSSLFHRTIPFNSAEQRICIAFDLKPAV